MNKNFFQRMHERDLQETPVNQSLKTKLAAQLHLQRSPSWFNRLKSWMPVHAWTGRSLAAAATLLVVVVIGWNQFSSALPRGSSFGEVKDDWQYLGFGTEKKTSRISTRAPSSVGTVFQRAMPTPQMAAAPTSLSMNAYEATADAKLGFSVGGAKDISSFRENIKNGYLPLETDLTYEGLFYDYSFETGQQKPCADLFCPSYARAIVQNPITQKEETYLSVGLNSNINAAEFNRPNTDFVVVLDISGSMGSPFDQYYYDRMTGEQREIPATDSKKTKMELANEALTKLVDQLRPEDRLGIVLFSDAATVAKPLRLLGETDRSALKRHILEVKPTNGTNMSAGLEAGARLLRCNDSLETASQCVSASSPKRLIFLTDAMPNAGEFGAAGLHERIEQYAQEGIETSVIGVGVDFQTELVEQLTKVRGANYLSLHSARDFEERLGQEFDFLVSPLVYDLRLNLSGSDYQIEQVYGSPDTDLATGELLHVRTLFPSKSERGEVKGGLVLLKLRKIGEGNTLTLRARYQDKAGKEAVTESVVSFADLQPGTFDTTGIRKGVLLVQYGTLLNEWMRNEWGNENAFSPESERWERSSRSLTVSDRMKDMMKHFMAHFAEESTLIGDTSLRRERDVLDRLIQAPTPRIDDWQR